MVSGFLGATFSFFFTLTTLIDEAFSPFSLKCQNVIRDFALSCPLLGWTPVQLGFVVEVELGDWTEGIFTEVLLTGQWGHNLVSCFGGCRDRGYLSTVCLELRQREICKVAIQFSPVDLGSSHS